MSSTRFFFLILALAMPLFAIADNRSNYLWDEGITIPANGRPNPYNLAPDELTQALTAGKLQALHYPIEVTGTLLPYRPFRNLLTATSANPLKWLLQKIFQELNHFQSFDDMEDWLGLQAYPNTEESGVYYVPFLNHQKPEHRMGFTIIPTQLGAGFTISCGECHVGNLFGRPIIGLTNRFPRANTFFARGLRAFDRVEPWLFQWATDATADETEMFRRAQYSLQFVTAKTPLALGLDTSLAQVALSLAKRSKDPWASLDPQMQPSAEPLAQFPADSKPAVWWNLKYKNRWLSDGSVVSGNPIFTNFLWNEIGRGVDLHRLSTWLSANENRIRELTTAVFSSQAPSWSDYFEVSPTHIAQAKLGEKIYLQYCLRCHGQYLKAWSTPGSEALPLTEQIKTVEVRYHSQTPVFDVGTDPHRYQGMQSLVQLNSLALSQSNGTLIRPQTGYVPPPLVGIWARWPYLHNNSVPNLCELLKPSQQRVKTYWAGEALDRQRDFDSDCNGYPIGQLTPPKWTSAREYFFDTRQPGMSNEGHDEGLFVLGETSLLSPEEVTHLIRFLQTL